MLIKKDKLFWLLCCLYLIIDSRFFYLVPLPQIFGGPASNKTLIGICSILFFLILVMITAKNFKLGCFGKDIIVVLSYLMVQSIIIHFRYQYKLSTLIFSLIPFGILLGYFIFIRVMDIYFTKFIRLCEIISIILSIILIFQLVLYNWKKIMFLKFTLGDWYVLYHPEALGRFYSVAEGLIRASSLFSAYLIFSKENNTKFIDKCCLVCSLLAVLLVDQSRIYLISTLIAIVTMYLIMSKKKVTLSKLVVFSIVSIVFLGLIIPKVQSLMGAMSDINNGSFFARMDAISYYSSIMKDHLFTGLGVVIPDQFSGMFYFIKGPEGIYNFDDIGIFGIIASMGILGALWYIYIIIKSLFLTTKVKDIELRGLVLAFEVQMIMCSLTESYLDKPRLITLALFLALISYAVGRKKDLELK